MVVRVYLRCSSDSQDLDSQRHAVKAWLAVYAKDATVRWYEDEAKQGDKERPRLNRLMNDVRKGDTVLTFALDRVSRAGIVEVLTTVQTFNDMGVRLVSVSEPWADSTNPVSEVVIAVMAWAAMMEKRRLKARQKAGIEAARAVNGGTCPWGGGKKGVMKKRSKDLDDLVRRLRSEGKPVTKISELTKLSRPTIYQILAEKITSTLF